MARGPKRHLKRLNAPKHWMLDKLGGVWAPRPSTGPHKLRECLPLIILLRNRLKYALNTKEVKYILMQRLVKVDGKARTDKTYPSGFMGAHPSKLTSAEHARRRPTWRSRLHLRPLDVRLTLHKPAGAAVSFDGQSCGEESKLSAPQLC